MPADIFQSIANLKKNKFANKATKILPAAKSTAIRIGDVARTTLVGAVVVEVVTDPLGSLQTTEGLVDANELVIELPDPFLEMENAGAESKGRDIAIDGSGSGGEPVNVGVHVCKNCQRHRPCPRNGNRAADGSRCGKRSAWSRGPTRGYDD